MLIDPFTVIAQIVNFAVLALALKHFLYRRVIDAMDAREAAIADRLAEAAQREQDADASAQQYNDRLSDLDDAEKSILEAASAAAEQQRVLLLDEARSEVERERDRWQRALRNEQREVEHDLHQRTIREVLDLSSQVVADVADVDIEARAVDKALDQLAESADATRELTGDQRGSAVTVRTAFAMDQVRRGRVVDRLRDIGLPIQRRVRFEQQPDLLLGVEIQIDGTAFSWNSHDYITQIASALDHDEPADGR